MKVREVRLTSALDSAFTLNSEFMSLRCFTLNSFFVTFFRSNSAFFITVVVLLNRIPRKRAVTSKSQALIFTLSKIKGGF